MSRGAVCWRLEGGVRDVRSSIDFGFSFDAASTVDMVLYFGGLIGGDGEVWRRVVMWVQIE